MADMTEATAPVPADGPVLCRCGNPDNCSCPPVERTVRLVIENAAPGGPAHTVIFDGRAYPVLGCKPDGDGMTETYELRQRPTALAGDPGDLPARMTEAMRVALVTWSEGAQHEHLAKAAMSVRDELVAHLAARVGDAERRAEHAESEHQVTQDRLAEARAATAHLIRLMEAGRIVELMPLGDGVVALTLTGDPTNVQMQGTLVEVLARAQKFIAHVAPDGGQ